MTTERTRRVKRPYGGLWGGGHCDDTDCPWCYMDVSERGPDAGAAVDARDTSVWTTADGRKLKLTEMSDNHLANTIGYLERKIGVSDRTAWLPALRAERERRNALAADRREREVNAPPVWLADPTAKGEKPSRAEQRAAMRAALAAPRNRRTLAEPEELARRMMERQAAKPSALDGLKLTPPRPFELDDYVFATQGERVPTRPLFGLIGRELATPVIDDPSEFRVRTFTEPDGRVVAQNESGSIKVTLKPTSGPEGATIIRERAAQPSATAWLTHDELTTVEREAERVVERKPEPERVLTIESVMPSKGIPVDDIMDVLRENLVQHEQKKVQRG